MQKLTGAHHQMTNDNHQTKAALTNLLSKADNRTPIHKDLTAQDNAQQTICKGEQIQGAKCNRECPLCYEESVNRQQQQHIKLAPMTLQSELGICGGILWSWKLLEPTCELYCLKQKNDHGTGPRCFRCYIYSQSS